ncbi:M20/M25/M40 family metallo-hydrolase [Hufsiella ginkgonis]|uniref:M20/M25/M40 family metallo-hydrolase n=1 Tax=Hufsiella ginkgonis TaxID=2695274 RepID=A0A7K1XYS5_9SPHI|nr:M20/M25/M40 family metallo-hydrolase [Hufsiella ginkgonis]MXV15987.1 M20/M25/M40 family metallo-hydrolase [Hufsiella ginkgonis]
MKLRLTFLLILAAITTHAQLSPQERKIIDYVNRNLPAAEQLLIQTVNINSGTLNKEGVRRTGDIFRKEFDKIGFTTEWVNLPDSLNRAGHLVAVRKGANGKKRLLLIGHLDTVFELDMKFSPYTRLNDSTATGQGANDMKGGDVIMIAALQALNATGSLKDASIIAYLTGDEEKPGLPYSVARADFIAKAKISDISLGFEGAQGLNTVATARRGSSSWTLGVTAKTGHSSGVFGRGSGYGAIYEAARVVNSFREELSAEKYLTFNPGMFIGGTEIKKDAALVRGETVSKTNIIAPEALVTGDLRFITEAQKEAARAKMSAIAAQNLNGTKSSLTFSDGYPAMSPTAGNNRLVTVLDKISRDMGIGATNAGDPGSRGAGDISFVAQYTDCLDGLGASGGGSHNPGETINLKQFPYLVQRAALLIYRLSLEDKE